MAKTIRLYAMTFNFTDDKPVRCQFVHGSDFEQLEKSLKEGWVRESWDGKNAPESEKVFIDLDKTHPDFEHNLAVCFSYRMTPCPSDPAEQINGPVVVAD